MIEKKEKDMYVCPGLCFLPQPSALWLTFFLLFACGKNQDSRSFLS